MRTTLTFLIAAQGAIQASLCLCRSEGAALRVAALIPAPDQPAPRDNAAVISTEPIGPIAALKPPTLVRTEPGAITAWEAEVAADPNGADIVWKSQAVDGRRLNLVVDQAHGAFSGSRVSESALESGTTHWVRVREAGQTQWSPWHAPFK